MFGVNHERRLVQPSTNLIDLTLGLQGACRFPGVLEPHSPVVANSVQEAAVSPSEMDATRSSKNALFPLTEETRFKEQSDTMPTLKLTAVRVHLQALYPRSYKQQRQ